MKSWRWLAVTTLLAGTVCAWAAWAIATAQHEARLNELWSFAENGETELAPIKQTFGPDRYSRAVEEWLIRDYFQDRRGGVFLDVGANHYMSESNTYFLETRLGWSGVAIDALEEFAADYRTHRPRTTFVALFASDVANSTVQFFVPDRNKLVASIDHGFTVRANAPGKPQQVPTTTLNVVLEQAGISGLDFVSMDIELSEPKALAGFDIGKYRPALVCIEAHPEVRQQILDYFARNAYTVVGKYLRADSKNLYFRPLVH